MCGARRWWAGLALASALLVLLAAPSAYAVGLPHPPAQTVDAPEQDETPTATSTATATFTPTATATATPSIQSCTEIAPFVTLQKRVGLASDVCAAGANQIEIVAGSLVYYCYALAVAANSPVAVTALSLLDDNPLLVVPWQPGMATVAPGETIQASRAVPSDLQPAITETRVTSATWNLLVNGLGCPVTSNVTTVNVVRPLIEATLRVAGTTDPCTVTTAVSNIGASQFANYCLTIRNTGNIQLTDHVIDIPQLGINNVTVTTPITPGGVANITATSAPSIPQLTRMVREPEFTAEVKVVSRTATGFAAAPAYNAATSLSAANISVRKVVTVNPNSCPDTSDTLVVSNQFVYFCYLVTNNGPVELIQQSFTDAGINVSSAFNAMLLVNGTLRVYNDTLVAAGAQPVLGPFLVRNTNINGVVNFVARNTALNFSAQHSSASGVTVVTPTPGPTDAPTPTSTPVPFPTATALPTWTPFPPTWTPTPTWTPAPTWTPPPTVIIFSTPGGAATPYPTFGASSQQPGAQPPFDPFAATVTAQAIAANPFAATVTAQAIAANPFAATVTAQAIAADPFAATVTAQAIAANPFAATVTAQAIAADPFAATVTAQAIAANSGSYPPPGVDPFAATATALAIAADPFAATVTAQAIAADPFAATVTAQAIAANPFAATATAQALAANSGAYPAPGVDPFAATATAQAIAANPSVYPAPGVDPFVATATALALQMNPGAPPSGDGFAATATAQAALLAAGGYPPPGFDTAGATATIAVQLGLTPPGLATATTATPAAVVVAVPPPVVVTPTPDPNVTVAPTQRPLLTPTPAPRSNALTLLASVLDSAATTLTMLGLLAGAGLLFAVAIVLIVLTVRANRRDPFALTADDAATFAATPPAENPSAEEHWPTTLP